MESADLLEHRACGTSDSSNPSAAASQPSQTSPVIQPANAASGHRGLQPPGRDGCKLFYRGIQSVVIRPHRPLSVATGCHRAAQAGKLSGTHCTRGAAKHATIPSNIDDMANFPANRVMGRLWDDHFMDLGYPSKCHRVQDAIFIDGSLI